ncbi:hypothetical protein WME73_03505 [Sorangium sp. So ce302]|uniref:hypothetical protein n=1 Tax=Sorangium sp. So ce302 TaxID=3133297 RepID=UPI003F617CCA
MRQRLFAISLVMLGAAALPAGFLAVACSPAERSFGDSGGGGTGGASPTGSGGASPTGSGGASPTGSGGASPAGSGTGGGVSAGEGGGGGTGAAGGGDTQPLPPEVVATGLDDPYSIAVDDQSVFILSTSTLLRCPLAGCPAPVVLAEGLGPPSGAAIASPYLIAVDPNFVHWLSSPNDGGSRRYYRCPAAGCFGKSPVEVLESIVGNLNQIEVSDDGVARISDKFDVLECDNGQCQRIRCVSADGIRSFVMDGTTVYWAHATDPGGVYFCDPGNADGAIQLHAEHGVVMAIHDGIHYVMNAVKNTIFACKKTGCGGSPTTFVEGEPSLTSMAVGPTGVYWTALGMGMSADGVVKMCPLDGCGGGPRVIASNQARPTSVRLRNGFVYWSNRGLPGSPMSGEIVRAGL